MTPLDMSAGRHYQMPPAPSIWNCVQCDKENVGPLDQGCVHCGAGKQLPPLVVNENRVSPPAQPITLGTSGVDLPAFILQGFRTWARQQGSRQTDLNQLLPEVFMAGYQFALDTLGMEPPARPEPEPMTPAGAQARTLAAALAHFIENVLRDAPDEIESGEWLTVNEAETLLKRLQEEGRR